jgi:hypothetical protein
MTDFQLGLVIVGVLLVAGVLVYNRVQERRARRDAERAFASGHADALLDETRREPTLGPAPRAPQVAAGTGPDPRVDYVMALSVQGGVPGSVLREHWAAIELRFAGRALLDGGRDGARAALQLVSRSGVVPEAELLEFRSAVETLAARIGAAVDAPEMRQALESARELDRLCAEADIQVALHVVDIAPAAAPDASAPFRVEARQDGVTLALDVARTADPARAYDAMARAAVKLAAERGGRVVDDNGNLLGERALASIGAQLEAVREMLAARGIEPGSPLALRLFS